MPKLSIEPSDKSLALEVWHLFTKARNARIPYQHDLRRYAARTAYEEMQSGKSPSLDEMWDKLEDKYKSVGMQLERKSCDCLNGESCDACHPPDQEVCTLKETIEFCKKRNVFDGLTKLLTLVKAADYRAAVEQYYAPVGNKPMELKAPPISDPTDAELTLVADVFYGNIEQFLTENDVRITELTTAFDLTSLAELAVRLRQEAQQETQRQIQNTLNTAEQHLERLFGKTQLMREYLRVIQDTEDAPIGVLWCNDAAFVNELETSANTISTKRSIKPTAERVDPCYFWATPDWTRDRVGRAAFRLVQKTAGDLEHIRETVSPKLQKNIAELLKDNGHRNLSAHLFVDDMDINDGLYDVLICRGTFDKKLLRTAGLEIKSNESMVTAEVWYAKGMVLYATELESYIEHLGIFTTYFRNQDNTIWGISLHDFIEPFARMYEGAIKALDKSVAKSVGSIVMVDLGVMDNFENEVKKDKEGNYILDFTSDKVFSFDSTQAGLTPNFKGIPIHVTKLPHDMDMLIPIINVIFQQIEVITGIPAILSTGNPDSSAVRTDDSYRTAYRAANAKIASLIKYSRDEVLFPSIRFFYHHLINNGLLKGLPIEAYPEILADRRLELDKSNARNMAGILMDIGQYAQLLPPEKVAGLINNLGREVYGFENDIIPNVNPLGAINQAQQPAMV